MMTTHAATSSSGNHPRGASDHETPTRGQALKIAAWYAVLSMVWIAVSGRMLHQFVHDSAQATLLEDVKGWWFVSVTAVLLWLMLDRQFRKIRLWAQRIQASEATLLLVGDNLPDSYVYQYGREEGRGPCFTHVSAGVERVHGLSVAEVLHDAHCLMEQIGPDQLVAMMAAEAESARTLSDFDIELRVRRPDGQERLIRLRARPRRDEDGTVRWDGFASDVTDSRRAEQALEKSEQNFRAMFEVASIGMAQTDPQTGQWTRVNRKLSEITGYSEAALCGMKVFEITHPEDRARDWELFQRVVRGDAPNYHIEKRYVRRDGSLAWVNVNMAVIRDADGRAVRTMATIEDITERKQLEAQLLQAQKMEAIGQLAGGVAHDFNNILGAMIMQAEVASAQPGLPDEVAESLQEMRSAAERAASLTRQLLLFSRKQVMQPRDLDLNDVVTSLAKMLQRIIGEDIRLQLHLHPGPLTIRADAGMVEQVLMNLAVNARDAMPEGGRLLIDTAEATIDAEAARLQADASPGRYASLRVTDTGCGIPPEVLPRIFEPFFTTKEVGKGTGLGLATVFGIVKQHQGWITVDSETDKGTSFQIFLPVSAAPAHRAEAARAEPSGGSETLLLVEDDRAVRVVTRRILEMGGYTVLEAASGADALAIWEQHRASVALLLTDLVMPGGISGQELARRFQEAAPGLKVIYTSGYSPEFAGRGIQLEHGENFVQKPSSPSQLLGAVRRSLDS